MTRYRRKPIEVDAVTWLGLWDLVPHTDWLMSAYRRGDVTLVEQPHGGAKLRVRPNKAMPQGGDARPGDVVLHHPDGVIETCSVSAFERGYEPVDPPVAARPHHLPGPPTRSYWDTRVGRPNGETPATCQADRDGDCDHPGCPQVRDGEPRASGRSCPVPGLPDGDRDLTCDHCDSAGRCTYLCEG